MNDERLELILSRDVPLGRDASTLRRNDDLVVVRRGVRVHAAAWRDATPLMQFRTKVDAVAATWAQPVFLRESAAALWRLPIVEPPPAVVDVMAVGRSTSRTRNGVAERHSDPPPLTTTVGEYEASTLAQTVFDLSRFASFRRAVTVTDHALRLRDGRGEPLLRREELLGLLDQLPFSARGVRQSAAVIGFADARAESPLESISRVGMHVSGIPTPMLQRQISIGDGRSAYLDFAWPLLGVVGEADGRSKYTDPAFLKGRTPEEAVYDEKRREDAIRSVVRGFARWSWNDAYAVTPMLAELAKAGVLPTPGTPKRTKPPV